MIDLHCHVLPGIDDGPGTLEGSLALARAAAQGGARTLVATPHVNSRYPNRAGEIVDLVEQLNERLSGEEVAVEVLAGAEIAVTHAGEIEQAELLRLRLGGGEWLLVEPPFSPVATALEAMIMDVQRRGHRIVIAHPERCPAFHRDPAMLGALVRGGALTSLTAGSLVGDFGRRVRNFALALVREELVHNVASDSHDHANRPPGMAEQLQQAGLGSLTGWLTEDVPAAILYGGEVPPRPPTGRTGVVALRSPWRSRR